MEVDAAVVVEAVDLAPPADLEMLGTLVLTDEPQHDIVTNKARRAGIRALRLTREV